MKKILGKSSVLLLLFATTAITSCDKFPLIKDESLSSTEAGINLRSMTIWEFLAMNDYHANDATGLDMYAKAIEYTGLKDMLNGSEQYTVVALNNDAMKALYTRLGYTNKDLTDIPAILIKNMLLNLIVKDVAVDAFGLTANQVMAYPTLSKDTLYLSREPSVTDEYKLFVNKAPTIASTQVGVRTQNLKFKNGVINVIAGLTFYLPKAVANPDNPPANVDIKRDTIYVTKDAYIQGGVNQNKVLNSSTDIQSRVNASFPDLERRAIFQFAVRRPIFSERINSVKLVNYISRLDGGKGATANVFEEANVDWNEAAVTWANAPAFGTKAIASYTIPVTNGINKYYDKADITIPFLDAINAGKTFINLAVFAGTDLVYIRPREYSGGNFKSFLAISSSPATVLVKENNNTLNVDAPMGFNTLTLNELKFSGTVDKNIILYVRSLPAKGLLVKNGLPLPLNASFVQEEVAQGIIKYLYTGNGPGSDSFTLEAKDFQGGYYKDLITVPVQIQ